MSGGGPDPRDGHALVSAILVTYNSASVIADALASLKAVMPGVEVLVVDNGSSDATVELATAAGATVVEGHGNVGFGGGVNVGARAAGRPLLLVMNPDSEVLASQSSALRAPAAEPQVGIASCLVREDEHEGTLIRGEWGWRREIAWALGTWFLLPREVAASRPAARRSTRRPWASGAAFVVRRDEFLRVGGFDERFFLYFEDMDLSRRYRAAGLPVRALPSLSLAHVGQGSSPRSIDAEIGWAMVSLLQYTAVWNSPRAAQRAARQVFWFLRVVAGASAWLGLVPVLGPRVQKKATTAHRVLEYLESGSVLGGPDGRFNSDARSLIQTVDRHSTN